MKRYIKAGENPADVLVIRSYQDWLNAIEDARNQCHAGTYQPYQRVDIPTDVALQLAERSRRMSDSYEFPHQLWWMVSNRKEIKRLRDMIIDNIDIYDNMTYYRRSDSQELTSKLLDIEQFLVACCNSVLAPIAHNLKISKTARAVVVDYKPRIRDTAKFDIVTHNSMELVNFLESIPAIGRVELTTSDRPQSLSDPWVEDYIKAGKFHERITLLVSKLSDELSYSYLPRFESV